MTFLNSILLVLGIISVLYLVSLFVMAVAAWDSQRPPKITTKMRDYLMGMRKNYFSQYDNCRDNKDSVGCWKAYGRIEAINELLEL